jgi:hypothetical protein
MRADTDSPKGVGKRVQFAFRGIILRVWRKVHNGDLHDLYPSAMNLVSKPETNCSVYMFIRHAVAKLQVPLQYEVYQKVPRLLLL